MILISNRRHGFTLIELVIILLLVAILSLVASVKFFNLNNYQARTAYDEIATALRYAQKLAVGSGCEVKVVLSSNSYALQQHATDCTTGSFTTIAGHPVNSGSFSDVSLSATPTSFSFDPMGRCINGTNPVDVTVGVAGRPISVVGETGYVDAP